MQEITMYLKYCLSQVIYVVLVLRGFDIVLSIQSFKSKLGILKPQPNLLFKMAQEMKADSMEHNVLVGGVASRIYKHPYAASIMKDGDYICGAAVINKLWVLTHLNCVGNSTSIFLNRGYLSQFTIRVGSNFNNKGGSIHKVKLVKFNKDHNFAAIKLTSPIEISKRVKAINLPETKQMNFGTTVEVSGWTISGHIRIVKMPILASSLCYNTDENMKLTTLKRDKFVCMGGIDDFPVGHNNVCRRDSGNPIAQNGYLLGIVPFSKECIQYKVVQPYPRVYSVTKWLDAVIWDDEKKVNYWDKPQEFIKLEEHYTTTRSTQKTKYTEKSTTTTTTTTTRTTKTGPDFIEAKPGLSLYEAYLKSLMPNSKSHLTQAPMYGQESQENTVLNSRVYLNAPAISTDEWAKQYSQDLKKSQNADLRDTHQVVTAKYDNLKELEKRMEFYNRNFA